ncbi:MAG TPA: TetR/AcrR family transcriptional regulator [Longimicrobiaceae bacterium]|nr:TetR/AcrR family transcriptional regulator [Longimicrobiaceae bacterium]
MARAKQFDPEKAVERAMDLFWCQGYEATSVDDLGRHLGIGKGSFYATFGSKQALYQRALDRYRRVQGGAMVQMLERPGPLLPRLRQAFCHMVNDTMREKRGCMMGNASAERAAVDPEAAARVRGTFHDVERALEAAIIRARDAGEIAPKAEPAAVATMLMAFLEGLQIMAKVETRPGALADAVELALATLG